MNPYAIESANRRDVILRLRQEVAGRLRPPVDEVVDRLVERHDDHGPAFRLPPGKPR